MHVKYNLMLARAERARDRIRISDDGIQYANYDAIDAIIFSVIALEAFINELNELAEQSSKEESDIIVSLGTVLTEAEKTNGSLRLKYMLVYQIFTGKSYDSSVRPFQDMHLLIDLRNSIVHYRPLDTLVKDENGVISLKPAKLIGKLRSKNILSNICDRGEYTNHLITPWLDEVSTLNCAIWCCETARSVIENVIENMPDGLLKLFIKSGHELSKRSG